MFSNLVLREKLSDAVRFVCKRETGGFLLPGDLATDKTGITEETVDTVLEGKKYARTPPPHKRSLQISYD